jgi:outer membrane lipoprotein-sorting protein
MAVQSARRSCRWRASTLARIAGLTLLLVASLAVTASRAQRASGASGDRPDRSFDEMYEEGRRRNGAMRTLTARFTETTTSSLLVRPLVAHGIVLVERPARVALRYSDPDERVIVIDDTTLTSSWPTTRTLNIATAMSRVQKQFIDGSAADLRREFEIDDRQTLATPDGYYVSMTPKRRQIREALTKLDLWVHRESLLLSTMRMTFASGDTKTMTFENVVANAPLPPRAFERPR